MENLKFLTTEEAAEICHVYKKYIREEITRGNLPAIKCGRSYLIDPVDLRAYLDARKVVAKKCDK